jgi:hypothetical protein
MKCTLGVSLGGIDWEVELQNVIQKLTGHVPGYKRSSSLTRHVKRISHRIS